MTASQEPISDLLKQFKKETSVISSLSDSMRFRSAISLVEIGDDVVGHIFSHGVELDVHLMTLLHKITAQNPIPLEHAGIVPEMRKHWLSWATENNYR
jgi:hypothetical protein